MKQELISNIKTTLMLALPAVGITLIFTFIMAYFERDANPGFRDFESIIWWWVVTVSTVGFGDLYPITPIGRIFGAIVILSALFFFAIFVSEMTAIIKLIYRYNKKGLRRIKYKNHIVIMNYNSLAESLIESIHLKYPELKIVVVTNKFEDNPTKLASFVNGDPKDNRTLRQANVQFSSHCIILADEQLATPDAYTLVVASEIEKLNASIFTVAEIIDARNRDLFKESGVDSNITERKFLKELIINHQVGSILNLEK